MIAIQHTRPYFWVQVSMMKDTHGLSWHLVVAQPVDCAEGWFAKNHTCTKCSVDGATSDAYGLSCVCIDGYFMDYESETCKSCPTESDWTPKATCAGGLFLPKPVDGYWSYRRDVISAKHAYRCTTKTCSSSETPDACWTKHGLANCTLDVGCREGSTGLLCGACKDR